MISELFSSLIMDIHYYSSHTVMFVLVILLLSVTGITCSKSNEKYLNDTSGDNMFRVWALADIQPRNTEERNAFQKAIEDVNNNTHDVDIAIVAGDIASRPDNGLYEWYNETKNNSYIDTWYEIIGNHDLKDDDGNSFRNNVREKADYKVVHGNLLFIFLSDSKKGKPTEIRDDTFAWWEKTVINNQDKVIIVVTHAPLEGSSIPFSSLNDRQIKDSERFSEVIQKYRVDIWLSGHLHLPNAFTNTVVQKKDFSDTIFVHISSIRPELMGLKNSESRFITFYCNHNRIRIDSRDHDSRKWHHDLVKEYEISKKVQCSS